MVKRRYVRHDAEFKFKLVMEMLTGDKTGDTLCAEYGVQRGTLYRWRDQLLAQGPHIFDGEADRENKAAEERIAELERLVGRLTLEVEVLKKASGLLSS